MEDAVRYFVLAASPADPRELPPLSAPTALKASSHPQPPSHAAASANPRKTKYLPRRYANRPLIGVDSQDSGVYATSPDRGPGTVDRQLKGQQRNRDLNEEKRELKARAKQDATALEAAKVAREKEEAINFIVEQLDEFDVTLGDLLAHTFGDGCDSRWRWKHFYKDSKNVSTVISAMASRRNPPQARRKAETAMVEVVSHVLEHEAAAVTKQGILRPPAEVDEGFVSGLELDKLPILLSPLCPAITKLLHSIAQTKRQLDHCTVRRLAA